jgi:AcrR family transcriptional regulator
MTQLPPAPRGTRPRNRRAQILAAAGDLFARRGYAQVAMSDLAESVGIGPSALYRHFAGKRELLATVLADGLEPIRALVDDLDPADADLALARLASCALDQRHVTLLWQRESRDLPPEMYQPLRDVVREFGAGLSGYVRMVRPELTAPGAEIVAWSILAVLGSTSFHHLDLPRASFERLLADLSRVVLRADLPHIPPAPVEPAAEPAGLLKPASRREELLIAATRLFSARGYPQVGIEDIGNAAGIAGPSVYNHWTTKAEILATLLRRGTDTVFMNVAAAYSRATSAADALSAMLSSYIDLLHNHAEIFGLLITDIDHLPDDERHSTRRAQHDFISEWTHLLSRLQPDLEPVAARIRVHAAVSVVNDTARNPRLHRNPATRAAVERICTRLLLLPEAAA